VGIPHTGRGGRSGGISKVPLDDDSSGGVTSSGEEEIGDLDDSGLTGETDLDGGLGSSLVSKERARGLDLRPNFSDESASGGNIQGRGDDVRTEREEDNLASGPLLQGGSEGGGIVGDSVSSGTLVLDVDDVIDRVLLVLRSGSLEEVSVRIQHDSVLGGGGQIATVKSSGRVGAVYVSLSPGYDSARSSLQQGVSKVI